MIFALKIFNYYKKLIFENRRWLYVILIIFAVGVVLGLFTAQTNPEITKKIIAQYAESIDKSLKPGWEVTKAIFTRNVFVVAVATLTSLILGFSSVFVVFINGTILGLFIGFGEMYSKITPWQLFLLLFPHGIFEYVGIFLGLSFSLRLGLNWLRKASKGKRLIVLKTNIKETAAILILTIIILGLAAIIEGFLTVNIACLFGGLCIK